MRQRRGCCIVAVGLLGMSAALTGCGETRESRAEENARRTATLAASPDQERLWREAADRGSTTGLDRVPVVEQPVGSRTMAAVSNRQGGRQPVTIAPTTETTVRILAVPAGIGPDGFSGSANVAAADGDRIALNLGPERLEMLARLGGKPVAMSPGDIVQVRYLASDDPRVPRDVLAVRTAAGDGFVQAIQGGNSPVTIDVPLFALSATQTGKPPVMAVEVTVGGARRTIAAGETAEVGGLTVRIVASTSYTGTSVGRIEGSPYTINLIAYPSR